MVRVLIHPCFRLGREVAVDARDEVIFLAIFEVAEIIHVEVFAIFRREATYFAFIGAELVEAAGRRDLDAA